MTIVYYIAIASVLLLRLSLSLTRYFDVDEFAHLHWTWLIVNGYLPYRDFFFYIIPGFHWLLAPVLGMFGDTPSFLIASRIFILFMDGIVALMVYRMSHRSLLAILIFLTLPVTIDKTIDIRPDMVMLALYFGSVLVKNNFLSGVLFGASFLVFPKIIFALPALLYLRRPTAAWLTGTALVGLGFFGYLQANNLVPAFLTSVTRDSFAVTAGKGSFSPLLLFTPYPLIYLTKGGVSLPWAVNTAVWIIGLAGLAVTVKTNRRMGIFWLLFIGGNIFFVILFPVPYVQYFLPLAIAASVLAARALARSITVIKFIIVITVISSFFLQYRERVTPGANNTEQLQVIRDVLTVTKPDESVYDMVGSFVFRPDGYFICCHPYGEFIDTLSRPISTLRESLVRRQTKFLVMDRVGFVFWQTPTPDLTFLLSNYLPTKYNKIYSLGVEFRCQQGACVPQGANRSTSVFTIHVPEKYTVAIEPNTASVTIDGKEIRNGQTTFLSAGSHRFSISPATTSLRIQLAR